MLKLDVEGCDYVMCCAYVVCLLGQLGVASFEASSAPRMGCWFLQGSSRCLIMWFIIQVRGYKGGFNLLAWCWNPPIVVVTVRTSQRVFDLPPNFYPRTDVALSNFSIVPFIAISTLANSPT